MNKTWQITLDTAKEAYRYHQERWDYLIAKVIALAPVPGLLLIFAILSKPASHYAETINIIATAILLAALFVLPLAVRNRGSYKVNWWSILDDKEQAKDCATVALSLAHTYKEAILRDRPVVTKGYYCFRLAVSLTIAGSVTLLLAVVVELLHRS